MRTYKADDASIEIIEECVGASSDGIAAMLAAGREALSRHDVVRPQATIALVSDERIRELNKEYRNKDAVTDVLSFADNEGEQLHIRQKREYLGDIAISLPTAIAQAENFGHSVERELAFLTVHGLLHLLGYDHEDQEESCEMFALQGEILDSAGISRSNRP